MRCYRDCILLIAVAGILSANALAKSGSLVIENCGDHLKVRAPQMHFLEGEALEMLHNGATVTYILTLTVAAEQAAKPEFLLREQFLISFDLWEEKYSVVKTGPDGRSASRLTAVLAEEWCLENMPIPLQAVPGRQSFMVRLECSVQGDKESKSVPFRFEAALTGLIDIFSRKSETEPPKWEAVAGPLRLNDLKRID